MTMRSLTYRSIFALNVPQTLQNLADWTGVAAVVPQKYAMAAALKLARDLPGERAKILELSPEMRLRADGMKSLGNDLQNAFRKSEARIRWEELSDLMMIPFETTQAMVELPVWKGAYDHATAPVEKGGLGLAGADAVRHADGAVRQYFGGRRTVDLTEIQRNQVIRHFVMFWGWAGTQLNLFLRARARAGVEWNRGTKLAALRLLGTSFALLSAKMVASELLTGHAPEDDDKDGRVDAGDVGRWVAFRSVMAVPSTLPVAGTMLKAATSGGPQRDVSLTPWTNLLDAVVKALALSEKAASAEDEIEDEQQLNLWLAWLEAGGSFVGAPTAQPFNTLRYWMNRPEDASTLTDILGTVYGRDKEGKLSHLTVDE